VYIPLIVEINSCIDFLLQLLAPMISFLLFGANLLSDDLLVFGNKISDMRTRFCLVMLVALLLQCSSGAKIAAAFSATEPTSNSSTMAASAESDAAIAERVLRETCAFYSSLQAFSFRITSDLNLKTTDKVTDKIDVADIQFERAPYFRVKTRRPKRAGEATLIDSNASFYKPEWRVYSTRNLSNINEFVKDQDFGCVTDGALKAALLEVLTADDPYSELMKSRSIESYQGLDTVDGVSCHHLVLRRKGASCAEHYYLTAGKQPWLKVYRPEENCPLVTLPVVETAAKTAMTRTFTYTNFRRRQASSNGRQFKPPAGALKVSQLVFSSDNDARQTLVGKPAPKFEVGTVNGARFSLSKLRGKVVVIEFWATWCSPCCRAMPVIDRVCGDFAGQGVQFIALNQKEDASVIKSFLQKNSLTSQVGLDGKGQVAALYHVVGIPQTVVVGKDGKVKSVHVGCPSDLREVLTQDLSSALKLAN